MPFAFEEHATRGRAVALRVPAARARLRRGAAPTLRRLPDARHAIDELRREPAAAIFARAHGGVGATSDDALFRTILLPLLGVDGRACGGFDWEDKAFEAAYAELERSLFGDGAGLRSARAARRAVGGRDRRARRRHARARGVDRRGLARSGRRPRA